MSLKSSLARNYDAATNDNETSLSISAEAFAFMLVGECGNAVSLRTRSRDR